MSMYYEHSQYLSRGSILLRMNIACTKLFILRYCGYIYIACLCSRGSVLLILSVLPVVTAGFRTVHPLSTPSSSYCGYIFACAVGVPNCSYSQYSQLVSCYLSNRNIYAGLLSTRNILAARTLIIIGVPGLQIVLERHLLLYLSVKPLF